jgi:hypothetical protein
MSITVKQLEALAEEFSFDIGDARSFLGIEAKKRGRPAKSVDDSPRASPRASTKTSPKASPKKVPTESVKRPPSGYNLFVKNQGVSVTEAAKQWKALSDSGRKRWNNKAKAV